MNLDLVNMSMVTRRGVQVYDVDKKKDIEEDTEV